MIKQQNGTLRIGRCDYQPSISPPLQSLPTVRRKRRRAMESRNASQAFWRFSRRPWCEDSYKHPRGNIALELRQSLSKTQIPNRSIHFNVHLALLLRQVSNGFHNLFPIPAHPAPASCRAASQLERPSARLGCAAGSEWAVPRVGPACSHIRSKGQVNISWR